MQKNRVLPRLTIFLVNAISSRVNSLPQDTQLSGETGKADNGLSMKRNHPAQIKLQVMRRNHRVK